jgi:hypothetical protein
MKRVQVEGHKFGRWTVEIEADRRKGHRQWLCRCECGSKKVIFGTNLKRGLSRSCGCLQRELQTKPLTHGQSGRRRTSEYIAWFNMKQRCYNPQYTRYKNWGGRGIRVCDRWLNSFENFLIDMDSKPSPEHSLDRKDNDGDYEPSNCRWATDMEQRRNRTRRYANLNTDDLSAVHQRLSLLAA